MDLQSNPARGTNVWDDLYGTIGQQPQTQLTKLPLDLLDPWVDITGETQPFKAYTPQMLRELADNIRTHGILQPILVRPKANSRFEIISGHNRVAASKIAGLTVIPALVAQLDDTTAAIQMVDSNLKHRPFLLPSEKARAFRLRMEKLNPEGSRQGHRTDLTSAPLEQKLTSRDLIAKEMGISHAQVQRYIRLTWLLPELLDMVDNGALEKEQQDKNIPPLAIRAGVDLSYLTTEQQELLLWVIHEEEIKPPSAAQAAQLRQLAADEDYSEETVKSVFIKPKSVKPRTIQLPAERISSFFPPNTTVEEMEAQIYAALLHTKTTPLHPHDAEAIH